MQRGKPTGKRIGHWIFNRDKIKDMDYFLCISLIDGRPFRIYLIPNNDFPKVGACIGWTGKYNKFIFKEISCENIY